MAQSSWVSHLFVTWSLVLAGSSRCSSCTAGAGKGLSHLCLSWHEEKNLLCSPHSLPSAAWVQSHAQVFTLAAALGICFLCHSFYKNSCRAGGQPSPISSSPKILLQNRSKAAHRDLAWGWKDLGRHFLSAQKRPLRIPLSAFNPR